MTVLSDRVDVLEATNASMITTLNSLLAALQQSVDINMGPQGWSPIFTVQNDGIRQVFQVTDWVNGGTGATKPPVGDYVGATGLVADIANAVNIGGVPGVDGNGWTGATYDANTGIITFTSDDGLEFSTGDLRGDSGPKGDGFTGGSYDAGTGVVTFGSNDGIGFATGDLRGTDGSDGADGSVWFSGTGAPSNGLGVDGDLYLDDATGDLYQRNAGVYAVIDNIIGPMGASGGQWFSGSGAPAPGLGSNGDFYLDTDVSDVYEKASGSWSIVDNIKGADGAGAGSVTSVAVSGGTGIDTSGGPITSSGTINVALDAATQASLGLADSAIQSGNNISLLTNDAGYTTNVGDITAVTAGTGLTGGGTSGGVTLSINSTVATKTGTATLTNKTIHGSTNTLTVDGTNEVGFRKVPLNGDKTASYNLATGDVGKCVTVGSGGSITIPNSTFSAGDIVSIYNATASDVTITCSITTAYIGGTDADKATMTLATRGVATVLFLSATACVVTGNVS